MMNAMYFEILFIFSIVMLIVYNKPCAVKFCAVRIYYADMAMGFETAIYSSAYRVHI